MFKYYEIDLPKLGFVRAYRYCHGIRSSLWHRSKNILQGGLQSNFILRIYEKLFVSKNTFTEKLSPKRS